MTPDGGIIHEDALIARHPWIGASRLRAAALGGMVPYLAGARRSRWYGPAEIAAVIDHFRTPCRAAEKTRSSSLPGLPL